MGLGLPRPEELEELSKHEGLLLNLKAEKRDYSDGLPYYVIAAIEPIDEKTVGDAVRKCRKYLSDTEEGIDFRPIVKYRDEINFSEYLSLIRWPHVQKMYYSTCCP